MRKYFVISLFLLTFAKGIVGSGHPMIREHLIPPFPFFKEDKDINKRIRNMQKLTTQEFVDKAIVIHGNKYLYDRAIYNGGNFPVEIGCPIHGYFTQIAGYHLSGNGCAKCKGDKIKSIKNKGKEQFVADAKLLHGDMYDYSEVVYITSKDKVAIKCKKHGVFYQSPNSHLRGSGCPKCADEKTGERCRIKLHDFIRRSNSIHGNKYDYSLISEDSFHNECDKVEIICPTHGVFKQSIHQHLSGRGCYLCGKQSMANTQKLTKDEIVTRANKIFDGKYDYSLFDESQYKRKGDKIKIICPKHGIFEATLDNHLYNKSGCPKCKRSFGEEKVAKYLSSNGILYKEQYRVPNEDLFCQNKTLVVDFYVPRYNTFIEYNGEQHYKESRIFKNIPLDVRKNRDEALRSYCKDHRIKLIEIPYTQFKNIDKILSKHFKESKKNG